MRPANSGIRYTKQYDQYSCGPTALINTLKWAGSSISLKKGIKHYQTKVLCTKINGTGVLSLDFALQGLPKVKIVTRYSTHTLFPKKPPKWSAVKAHLQQGGTLILRYDWPSGEDAHYVLVTHLTTTMAGVVNYKSTGPSHSFIHQRTLRQLLRQKESLVCWLLSKKQ